MAVKRHRKDLIFVGIQLLLFLAYLIVPALLNINSSETIRTIGVALEIAGTGILLDGLFQLRKSLTPFPSVRPDGHLVTNGIYRFIRHPLYTGILSGLLGYGLYKGHGGKLIIVVLLFALFYAKSSYEERLLLIAYPDYKGYRQRTGRFLPNFNKIFNHL